MANAGTVSTWEPANAALSLTPGTDSAVLPLGLILVTSNGGSIWRGVPLFPSFNAVSNAKRLEDNTAFRTAFSNPFPGILFGVSSDDKGRNVYAVGSPGVTLSTSARRRPRFPVSRPPARRQRLACDGAPCPAQEARWVLPPHPPNLARPRTPAPPFPRRPPLT